MNSTERGGQIWPVGSAATVAWIQRGFRQGYTVASAIPPVFDSYATIVDPWDEDDTLLKHFDREWVSHNVPDGAWLAAENAGLRQQSRGWQVQQRLVEQLSGHRSTAWWLGYLDTGPADVVFPEITDTPLYVGWPYKLVKAGPDQALSWRGVLPDLMFPDDHAWCVSMGWDDSWTCIGGPAGLIDGLCSDDIIAARQVSVDQDATPPGHVAF